ncbi:MAG: ABC transporter permease [Thermoplasmatota archaeon]
MSEATDYASDVYTLWWREGAIFFRNRIRLVSSFFQPILWLVLMGYGIRNGLVKQVNGVDYIYYIVPGVMGLTMLFGATQGGMALLQEKDHGFLLEVLVAPVRRTSILLGKALGLTTRGVFRASLTLLVAIILGMRFGGVLDTAYALVGAFVTLLLLGIPLLTLGLIAAWELDDLQAFGSASQWLVMPLYFLSGALYPVDKLPDWLRYVTYVDPLTYGVDALRSFLVGIPTSAAPLWVDLGILFVFGVVTLVWGARVFSKTE